MAKIGTAFKQKYPWHSQLAAASPLVIQITGEKQFRPKEAPTFFFKVQGDPEGEYGMKPAGQGDNLYAYYAAMVKAPKGEWLSMTASGREKEETDGAGKIIQKGNQCTITFNPVEGGVAEQTTAATSAPEPSGGTETPPWAKEETSAAPEAPQAAPAPQPRNGPVPTHNYPYPTMMDAYVEALRASYTILSMDGLPLGPDDTESLRAIAATLMISQKEIHRAIGLWIPIR